MKLIFQARINKDQQKFQKIVTKKIAYFRIFILLNNISNLNFFEPDFNKFPGLKLGWQVLESSDCSPVVLNASNEIAVDAFLKNKIRFTEIYNVVYETLNFYNPPIPQNIDDVIEIDRIARVTALDLIKRQT